MKYLTAICALCIIVLAGCGSPTGLIVTQLGSSQIVEIPHGGEFTLHAQKIQKEINGSIMGMFGYNGLSPGPLLKVKQNNEITIMFRNSLDLPTTVHWHGIRLDNQFDGVPKVTQEPVLPGETFTYVLTFPDPGVYWYHSHVRGDMQLEMGLYGNIIVEPAQEDYYNPVDKEEAILLDDIRLSEGQIEEFSLNETNYALMGRFGNQMLVNGMTDYSINLEAGKILRLYVTSAANTRMFNFSIENARLKVVGGDSGLYEKEFWADSVILGPGERAIIEAVFEKPGEYRLMHINPEKSYEMGVIHVSGEELTRKEFLTLRENSFISENIDLSAYVDSPPDFEIDLTMELSPMMANMMQGMDMKHEDDMVEQDAMSMKSDMMEQNDTVMNSKMMEQDAMSMKSDTMEQDAMDMKSVMDTKDGIEWEDPMMKMNAMSNNNNTKWILRNKRTGEENMDAIYLARVGDIKKLRLFNDPKSDHPMQHPIHLHGQRFLVLSVNGEENENLVWKDVVVVPKGATVDVLIAVTEPGDWLLHCHILEHAESGMKSLFKVSE